MLKAGVHHQIRERVQVSGDLLPTAGTALRPAVGVHPWQVVRVDERVARRTDRSVRLAARSRCRRRAPWQASAPPRRSCGWCRRSSRGSRRAASSWAVGPAAPRTRYGPPRSKLSAAVLAEADRRHQRGVDVVPLVVERARGGHGVRRGRRTGRRTASAYTSARSATPSPCRRGSAASAGSGRRGSGSRSASEFPNRSPSPDSAWAVAVNVALSLIGSTCSAIDMTVSNRVLNSVVTDDASIDVAARNALLRRVFRRAQGDVLVAEHGRRPDVGDDVGRNEARCSAVLTFSVSLALSGVADVHVVDRAPPCRSPRRCRSPSSRDRRPDPRAATAPSAAVFVDRSPRNAK